MRYLTIAMATVITAGTWSPTSAQASHDSPLYEAADHYRDAVRDFEKDVRHADYFNRYDEKLVDQLEDATSHLRSASRHLDHPDRLLYQWDEVSSLQPRVERAIFGRRCYPPDPHLARRWDHVRIAYDALAREMHLAGNRPFCAAPDVCNGRCGYHSKYQDRYRSGSPIHSGRYGVEQNRSAPEYLEHGDGRDAVVVRSRLLQRADRDHSMNASSTMRLHSRYQPARAEHTGSMRPGRGDVHRNDFDDRDLGAAMVGSFVKRLLD